MIKEKLVPIPSLVLTLKDLFGPNNPINYLHKLSPNPIPLAF